MPQQDAVHDVVKNAMEKDGWSITAKPHTITYFRSQMYADLRAEKTSEDGKKTVIVVEVKSFRENPQYMNFTPRSVSIFRTAICFKRSA